VYLAINNNLGVLSAVGIRTVFDRATELLGVNPADTFKDKLDHLEAKGLISVDEKRALGVLVDAGSAAAHRGWRPKSAEVDGLMLILESFLHRNFIASQAIDNIAKAVPAKPPRPKKPAKKK